MSVLELLKKDRSYRGFDESYHFTREQLLRYVDAARYCASSVNRQPLKYYIAYEKEEVKKIQDQTRWARALPQLTLPHPGKCPTAFIVICQDTDLDDNLARYQRDLGITAEAILLMAVEEGLGGCMIGNFTPGSLAQVLELPKHLRPMLVVALGKPDEKIVLTEADRDGDTNYYRDENDVHYVPKRKLEDIVIN